MKSIQYIAALIILFVFFGCKKKIDPPVEVGYEYAPTTIGKYIVYDVDSIVYDDFKKDTTYFKYRIKETLAEHMTDNEGRPAIKLIRYIKTYSTTVSYDAMNWVIKDVWTYTKTNKTLEVVEEDQRYTKLAFPINADVTWNGNASNTLGEWQYKCKYINQAETINNTHFDNVLYVEQKDDKNKNAIHRQFYIEKYAKNIGLVYREIKDLYSNTPTIIPNTNSISPVESRIEKGIIYKLTYVTHGVE